MRGNLNKLREWEEDDYDVRRDAETVPAPPQSDIRMIGQLIAESIAVEPPTIPPPPRVPRETVLMPMRQRQATLVMIDRPARSAFERPITTPSAPPRPFRGFMAVLLGAFALGLVAAGLVAVVFIRL